MRKRSRVLAAWSWLNSCVNIWFRNRFVQFGPVRDSRVRIWTKIASAKQIPYVILNFSGPLFWTENRTPPCLNNFLFEKITWLTLWMKTGIRYQKLILFLLLQSLFLYLLVWVERLPFRLWLCQVFFILN